MTLSWPILILNLALICGLAWTAYLFWRKNRQLEERAAIGGSGDAARDHAARLQRGFQMGRLCYWCCDPPDPDSFVLPARYEYSANTADVIGLTLEELAGSDQAFWARLHPDDREEAEANYRDFLASDRDHETNDYRMMQKDGSVRYIHSIMDKVKDKNGRVVEIAGILQDVTSQREVEDDHLRSRSLLRRAHRMAKLGYWHWKPSHLNDNGRSGYRFSEDWADVTGIADYSNYHYEIDEYCMTYVHPNDRERVRRVMQDWETLRLDQYDITYRFLHPTQKMIYLRSSAERVRDRHGHPIYATGVMQDVTDAKKHEAELLEAKNLAEIANRSKTEFLANMSHELRTPLNAIIGFSQLIRDQIFGPAPERYVEYGDDIYKSGRLLLDLINDILDMSRIEAGRTDLVEEPFALSKTLGDCLRLLSARIGERRIRIEVEEQASLPRLYADERAIKQVLLNVLTNAVKFTPDDGQILVSARRTAEGGLVLHISDTGIGIAPEVLPRLFTPFTQGDSTVARKYGGTGLGLAISRKLIEMHGGSIAIESTLGTGTNVTLSLPKSRVAQESAEDRRSQSQA